MALVPKVALGSQGLQVSAQGLGCMGMSAFYGPSRPDEEMIQLVHEAVERGVTFLDTSDFYGPHTNEILVGKALKGIRDKVQLATKFGAILEGEAFSVRGDPEYVRSTIEGSLRRLDVDCIDLYYQHRIDPKVPIEITMGEMKKLVQEGKIKYIGLSEASASDIRRAHAVVPISAIQIEYSLWSREVEDEIIPLCRELGIGLVAYSPLGRGFFSGKNLADFAENDYRVNMPRFTAKAFQENKRFYDRLCELGAQKKCTPGQLALAWVQHKGLVPIPGTTKLKNLEENTGAVSVKLSADEVQALEAAVPKEQVEGGRYSEIDSLNTWQFVNSPPLESYTGVKEA